MTVPSASKAGFSPARASREASWRMQPSSDTMAPESEIGTISPASFPAFCAAAALIWLARANSSCASRGICQRFATFSAVSPMPM